MTEQEVTNQYPCTFDMPPMMGAQDDPVELMLVQARKRVKVGHTRSHYIDEYKLEGKKKVGKRGVFVCAIGAVYAEDGLDRGDVASHTGTALLNYLIEEQRLSETAQEAITALNEAALFLHPEAGRAMTTWSGPLEWVNQEWLHTGRALAFFGGQQQIDPIVKSEILRCYDVAIQRRRVLAAEGVI